MKKYLIIAALGMTAWCDAQAQQPAAQQVAQARQEPVKVQPSPRPVPLRQLTEEQRAELRQQLYQYSRAHGKGS